MEAGLPLLILTIDRHLSSNYQAKTSTSFDTINEEIMSEPRSRTIGNDIAKTSARPIKVVVDPDG